MATGATLNRHKSFQSYSTPKNFIDAVVKRWGPIDFDLAAKADNAKAKRWYGIKQNSLIQDWTKLKGNLWLNPPFGGIAPWALKCSQSATAHNQIFFLVPASVGSNWFADCVFGKALVYFLHPRLSFDSRSPYPKDLILAVYGVKMSEGFQVWRWK